MMGFRISGPFVVRKRVDPVASERSPSEKRRLGTTVATGEIVALGLKRSGMEWKRLPRIPFGARENLPRFARQE